LRLFYGSFLFPVIEDCLAVLFPPKMTLEKAKTEIFEKEVARSFSALFHIENKKQRNKNAT
jgi:hypothetical protein